MMENENKEESDSDEEILFGFDTTTFENDGTTTADKELNGIKEASGSSISGLVFVNASNNYNNYHAPSPKRQKSESQSDDDIQPQPMDIGVNVNLAVSPIVSTTPKSPRVLSTFQNNYFDIVSFGASPLKIEHMLIDDIDEKLLESLEYIQNSMPDLHKLYWNTVWSQIVQSQKQVKCVNYRATQNSIKNVMNKGGCKILQFMGICCNPMEIESDNDSKIYKHLITEEMFNCNISKDYILLESDNNIINGKWYDINQLKQLFNSNYNDIVIVLSPNYKKMVNIFSKLGYKYICGIKTFNENVNKHNRDKNANKIQTFLTHFYSAILDGECIDRAFELALTVCNKDISVEADILKKLVSSESIMSELNKKTIERHQTIGPNNRFMLHIADNYDERYVVFHENNYGDAIDMGQLTMYSSCYHLQYEMPFIGRSRELIELYNAIIKYQIISCIGSKNYGRRSVIIKLMNYLQQHRYFTHGIMIVDCENKQLNNFSFDDIMEHRLAEQFTNVNGYAFNDILDDINAQIPNVSICIVILNVDAWRNKFQDPREWIKSYALKMPQTCKCIYTDDSDNIMKSFKKLPLTDINSNNSERMYSPSNKSKSNSNSSKNVYKKYIKTMQKFFTNSTFTATNISKLSNSKLSELFMNTLANSNVEFEIKHIENHSGLQTKFAGCARFVKRAAAWVSKLQTTENNNELTLDSIHDKLPYEWYNDSIECPETQMIVHHSKSISPWINPKFEKYLTPNDLLQQNSILLNSNSHPQLQLDPQLQLYDDDDDNKIDDTIATIRNATDISELINLLKPKHLEHIRELLLLDYKEIQSPLDIKIRLSSRNSLGYNINSNYNRHSFRSSFKSTASFQLTPPSVPPPEIRAGRHDTPFPTNIPFQTSMAYQSSHQYQTSITMIPMARSAISINYPSLKSVDTDDYRKMFENTTPVVEDQDDDDEIIIKTNSNVSNISHSINSLAVPTIRSDKSLLPSLPALDNVNIMCGILQYGKTIEHTKNSQTILPLLGTIQSHEENKASTTYERLSIGLNIELEDNKLFSKQKKRNNKRKQPNISVTNISVPKLPGLGVSNSRKSNKHMLNESVSHIDIEAIAIEENQDIKYNDIILNEKIKQLWKKISKNNRNITQLHNLQNDFEKKFQEITKLKTKMVKLHLLNKYYLQSFEIKECKELNNELSINISQFESFWNWLESLCYLIVKFKRMYKINDSRNRHHSQEQEFGMLIGKIEARNILLKQENKSKNGAFILYIDKTEQLNVLYRNSRYDKNNELKEYIIKYDKNRQHYTVNNTKDDPITFIKRTTNLKWFYSSKRKRLINKKSLFK
eukprot:462283_1